MREELKRSNSIGNVSGIDMILRLLYDDKVINIESISYSCRYQPLSQLNCQLALALFEEISLLEISDCDIVFTHDGEELHGLTLEQRKTRISELIVERLISERLIQYENITVDTISGDIRIPANAFSLSSAVYRNFLYSVDCLVKEGSYFAVKDVNLRAKIEKQVAQEKRKISQEELLRTLEKQQADGDKGESYVIEYEKKRLNNEEFIPKRISVIDVEAGYDIMSYNDSFSCEYDRYIEVKSYRGKLHFYWSSNEKRVAEALGEKYYIYLVDLNALEKNPVGYFPYIICNPVRELIKEEWLIEPDSYRIAYIND